MSRLSLAGYGTPIPAISLPDPNASGERPTIELLLEDGIPFEKAPYVALGYTHYEVWCVGGAGGRGGDEANQVIFLTAHTNEPAPTDMWNLYLGDLAYWDSQLNPPKNFYTDAYDSIYSAVPLSLPAGYLWRVQPGDPGWTGQYVYGVSHYQTVEFYNPGHILPRALFRDPFLYTSAPGVVGGGGGGGGVQRGIGLLADIPDSVPVEVGAAGQDAPLGQTLVNGPWTPPPITYGRTPALRDWQYRYPDPHTSFLPPQPGEDGGLSSFGELVKASGGKGGNPSKKWNGSAFVFDGAGGDGGIGGQEEAGGGGLGSNGPVNGQDGSWDGVNGGGGGGGRGGIPPTAPTFIGSLPTGGSPGIPPTDGGRGAFSYVDTSIFGARGVKGFWMNNQYQFDWATGDILSVTQIATSVKTPGGGGGTRAQRKHKYGSRAPTYSPDGLVMIRLVKLD
jgi:hypothetical protein